MKIEDLDYTFENADEFKVFPLNSSVIRDYDPFLCIFDCPGLPMFNPSMLLHGEQKTHVSQISPFSSIDQNSVLRPFRRSQNVLS